MKRDQWLLLISIIIFLSLAVYYLRPGWSRLFSTNTKIGIARSARAVRESSVEKIPPQSLPPLSVESEVDASTPWGRNPFLTEEEVKQVGVERLRVNTIIVGPPKAVAIVDGRAVMVGDKIHDEKIVEIRPNAVILEREGKKKILELDETTLSVAVEERKR
jgi:hypothetical protein